MKLIIWGAGGHGRVALDVARTMNAFSEIAFVDDAPVTAGTRLRGCELLHSGPGIEALVSRGYSHFHAAVGSNQQRARCFEAALRRGLAPATLVHPGSNVSPSARIGAGTLVMPRVVVNADAEIGDNCIVNTGAIVEHDCKVGNHVHLSPGVILGGGATVGSLAHLGIGAVALPGATIGEAAVVGAGAVVLEAVPPHVTAVGVPARVLREEVQ